MSAPLTIEANHDDHRRRGHRFSDRVAVVTGASGGIGRATARALGEEGLAVALLGRDAVRLSETETLTRAAGAREVVGLPFDFSGAASANDLIATIDRRLGGIDIVVHCSGAYVRSPMEGADIGDLDALYASNLRGPYRFIQSALPALRRARGDLVLINSSQGLAATGGVGQYAAMQHALKAMADSVRDEVNGAGVRVTVLHVGSTATPMQARVCALVDRPYAPERLLQPEDVAAMVVAALRLPRTAEVTSLTIRPLQKP